MCAFTEGKTVLAEVVMVAVVTVRGSSWGFTWRSLQSREILPEGKLLRHGLGLLRPVGKRNKNSGGLVSGGLLGAEVLGRHGQKILAIGRKHWHYYTVAEAMTM